jgi:hypothetical protein
MFRYGIRSGRDPAEARKEQRSVTTSGEQTATVVVRPKYPGEYPDLTELAVEFRRALGTEIQLQVVQAQPQAGFGVTHNEILQIWLIAFGTGAAARAGQVLVDEFVLWVKSRSRKTKRPQVIEIRGPNGKVIRSLEVKDGQVHDDTDSRSHEELSQIPPPKDD